VGVPYSCQGLVNMDEGRVAEVVEI
jgi:hypothetical protein